MSAVDRATAELLDGARDQREGLVRPVGEGVCDAERRGAQRCRDDDLPRSREILTPLENRGREREIPATEVDKAKTGERGNQRLGMIGRLSDLHRGLGVP